MTIPETMALPTTLDSPNEKISIMTTLDEFKKSVDMVETGQCPTGFQDLNSAIESLLNEICIAPWTTPEERSKAQSLVIRLEKVRVRLTP